MLRASTSARASNSRTVVATPTSGRSCRLAGRQPDSRLHRTDQRNVPRPPTCDAGAFEQVSVATITKAPPPSPTTCTRSSSSRPAIRRRGSSAATTSRPIGPASSSTARRRTRCATSPTASTSSRCARWTLGVPASPTPYSVHGRHRRAEPADDHRAGRRHRHARRGPRDARGHERVHDGRRRLRQRAACSGRPSIVSESNGGWFLRDRRPRRRHARVHRDRRRTMPATCRSRPRR